MAKELTQEEKDLRRRLRDALCEISHLTRQCNLVYMSEEEGPIDIEGVMGRLFFEVYDDIDDDDEQPFCIKAGPTDEQLE